MRANDALRARRWKTTKDIANIDSALIPKSVRCKDPNKIKPDGNDGVSTKWMLFYTQMEPKTKKWSMFVFRQIKGVIAS